MNLRILHNGMPWPVGAVIPMEAMPHGYADHLKMGAVELTEDRPTHAATPNEWPVVRPDFPALLRSLLVEEYGKTEAEAEALVKHHHSIVIHGIMAGIGFSSLRATAMAIEMAESKEEPPT